MKSRCFVLAVTVTITAMAAFVGQLSTAADLPQARQASTSAGAARTDGFTAQPISPIHDAIIGAITSPANHGGLDGIGAYSFGPTMCNVGTATLSSFQANTQHAVWGSNLYRIATVSGATRIEQIGQSWLMHQFCSLQGSICGTCTPTGSGCASSLGVGCSSPESASRAGQQNVLGPRFQVDASTGVFAYPATAGSMTGNVIFKRVQVAIADLSPALNPGAVYRAETFVVHPQDGADGNTANNASHIPVNVGSLQGTAPNQYYTLALGGPTVRELPAINAWKTIDPSVTITPIDVPGDGRFVVGFDVTDLGSGQWHYEYAIYNLSSHRSGQSFSVPIAAGSSITNVGFHDVDYHSQSALPTWAQVDNVDWTPTVTSDSVTWSTSPYTGPAPAGNEHTANALRFGTMYNFRFDADAPPANVNATLSLFRPGVPTDMSITLRAPGPPPLCPADFDRSAIVNGLDLAFLLGAWGPCPAGSCIADINGDGSTNGLDLALLLGAWGPCH